MKIRSHRVPGMILTDHRFTVPVNHRRPDDETIELYAREVVHPSREDSDLPYLVFLQGGPGFGAPRPLTPTGWIERALQEFRVLLFDQRGTGASTPVSAASLEGRTPAQQADYLACFRADAIVRDAEHVRRELCGDRPWWILGQSYGGFCAAHYLGVAAEGLAGVLIAGGLPPLTRPIDDVYQATYRRVLDRNGRYHERYPDDAERVRGLARQLHESDVRLPGGGRLTVRMLQQLGTFFGMSDGFEMVHYLLETAFVDTDRGRAPGYGFLHGVEHALPFSAQPIYAILHESIYCQGAAGRWSAERLRAQHPEFAYDPGGRLHFTGEMVYPWMFEDYAQLRPLREAAEILAAKEDWPTLYDVDALRRNKVPTAAVIYYDDLYVERRWSEECAAEIAGIRTWITDEYDHNGLRADGPRILGRLLELARGER